MRKIELDSTPRRKVFESIKLQHREPEMSEMENAFLCGLLNEANVGTVLEVGVAEGGTSAVIIQCLADKKCKYSFYGVDCLERFYKDRKYKTGWMGEEVQKKCGSNGDFSLFLGKSLPNVIDSICVEKKIDFVLLDTTHAVPGEILDFLLVLPYLSDKAYVCLHDISLNLRSPLRQSEMATNVLFNCVVADKIMNLDLVTSDRITYPNIGAFRINSDTRKYISNVFGVLTLNWSYFPPEEDLMKYREHYVQHYDDECIEIFDRAYAINRSSKSTFYQRIRKATKVLVKGKY